MTIASEIESITDQMAENVALEGLTGFGNRKYKGSAFARYGFSEGILKGLSLGLGYRYQSKNVVGVQDRTLIYGNSFWQADAMLGYDTHGFHPGHKLRLQLNVRNLFDETDPLILRYQGTGIRRYKLMDPREWTLSATYLF
ncbi:MAG TPA: TonB-dependent receptor [Opitutaceae bacterium]|nr:TonB-dependent receptor [Opitutaceae bacterium]